MNYKILLKTNQKLPDVQSMVTNLQALDQAPNKLTRNNISHSATIVVHGFTYAYLYLSRTIIAHLTS